MSNKADTMTKFDWSLVSQNLATHLDVREVRLERQLDVILVDVPLKLPLVALDLLAGDVTNGRLNRNPGQARRLGSAQSLSNIFTHIGDGETADHF